MYAFAKLGKFLDKATYAKDLRLKIAAQNFQDLLLDHQEDDQIQDAAVQQTSEGITPNKPKEVEDELLCNAMPELVLPDKGDLSPFGRAQTNNNQASPSGVTYMDLMKKNASAYLGDVSLDSLPDQTQEDIEKLTGVTGKVKVVTYGAVASELITKADKQNLDTAILHIKKDYVGKNLKAEKEKFFDKAKNKYIVILNDKIIDGHHFLARAKELGITNSLKVVDLTPVRFQKVASVWSHLASLCQR